MAEPSTSLNSVKGPAHPALRQALRKARGDRSQEEFARELGVKAVTYSRWDRGEVAPRGAGKAAVIKCLGVTDQQFEALLGPEGNVVDLFPETPATASLAADQAEVRRIVREGMDAGYGVYVSWIEGARNLCRLHGLEWS